MDDAEELDAKELNEEDAGKRRMRLRNAVSIKWGVNNEWYDLLGYHSSAIVHSSLFLLLHISYHLKNIYQYSTVSSFFIYTFLGTSSNAFLYFTRKYFCLYDMFQMLSFAIFFVIFRYLLCQNVLLPLEVNESVLYL